MQVWLVLVIVVIVVWLYKKFTSTPRAPFEDLIPRPPWTRFPLLLIQYLSGDQLRNLRRYAEVGDMSLIYLDAPVILCNSPELIAQVLKVSNRYIDPSFLEIFSDGLASSNGEKWKIHRQLLQTPFGSKNILDMQPCILECVDKYIENLKQRVQQHDDEGLVINLNVEMKTLTLDILTQTIFGFSAPPDLVEAMDIISRDFLKSMAIQKIPLIGKFLPNKAYHKLLWARQTVFQMADDLIKERSNNESTPGERKPTIMDVFLQNPDKFSTDDIRNNVLIMFFGGHDTTAYSIQWAVYSLCLNERPRLKLIQEIDAATIKPIDTSTQVVKQFPYLQKVIKESLRLFPSAVVTTRTPTEDCVFNGIPIPKNTVMWANFPALHFSPKLYKEPRSFRPEHFDAEEVEVRHKTHLVPFGGGVRRCIGESMSMSEQTLVLSALYKNFDIELANTTPIKPVVSITMAPVPDIQVRLKLRT